MDRSSSTKQIHYVFEINSQPNQANQEKSKIEDNKAGKIRNLAVKKENIMIEGQPHKFIIFYESKSFSAEKLFHNPFVKGKQEKKTKEVQKNFKNLLLNKNIDKEKIKIIEKSLFDPINVPRPLNKHEKSTLNNLINISGEFTKLSNDLTRVNLTKVEKEKALVELINFQKIFKETNLGSDEVKNLFHILDDRNLSDADLVNLLKPISISIEKRKIEEQLKNLDSHSKKLSHEDLTSMKDKLSSLNQELDILKNTKDLKNFEDKLKILENSSDEKSISLIIKLKNTIHNLKTEPKIFEISKKQESVNINLKTSEFLIAKNLIEKKLILSKISKSELLTTEELKFLTKFITDVSFDEKLASFDILDKDSLYDMSDDNVSLLDKKLYLLNKIPKKESLSEKELEFLNKLTGESLSTEELEILENLTLKKSLELNVSNEKLSEIISDLNGKLDRKLSNKSHAALISDRNFLLFENLKLTKQLSDLKSSIKNRVSDTELNAFIAELEANSDQKLNSFKFVLKIKPDEKKITSLIDKLKIEIDVLETEIPKLKSQLNSIQKSKTDLEKIYYENNALSQKAGIRINLTDVNLFHENIIENAEKFGIEIRKNIIQSKDAKAPANTEMESITDQSDSNDLSDKENILSNSKTSLSEPDQTSEPKFWKSVAATASSPRPNVNYLKRAEVKTTTISSNTRNLDPVIPNSSNSLSPQTAQSVSSNSSTASENGLNDMITNESNNDSNTNRITPNSQRTTTSPLSARNLAGNPYPIHSAPPKTN